MSRIYILEANGSFLAWDDKGTMATGAPYATESLLEAKWYYSYSKAETAAIAYREQNLLSTVRVIEYTLVQGFTSEPVTLPHEDPEWEEYQRLLVKFGGKR